jgi:probable selenium-dependent hydroxylase accessory protein YqeC
MTLKEAFGLKRGEMLSLIGAGGKTTTLYRLARELWEAGDKILVTTTTKMFKPAKPHAHRLFLVQDREALLRELSRITEALIVAAGSELEESGKLTGLNPDWLDSLKEKAVVDWILIEADGAGMKPFKVPADYEPLVPSKSDLTVWVMGIKVLGRPLASHDVHRAQRAAALLGVELGTPVTEDLILRLVKNPQGCLKGIPPKSRKFALINQADSADEVQQATALGRALLRCGIERVVITSYLEKEPVKEVITN